MFSAYLALITESGRYPKESGNNLMNFGGYPKIFGSYFMKYGIPPLGSVYNLMKGRSSLKKSASKLIKA
jgi:hypothetical protein